MKPTAKSIAKSLGLSEAAVSMALNNKYGVSDKTRAAVLEEAERQGLELKKDLSSGVIDFILYVKSGAVVSDTPFFSELSQGVAAGCRKRGFKLNISYLYEGESLSHSFNSKGIILLATEMDEQTAKNVSKTELPIVFLDGYFECLPVSSVVINNVQGAFAATDHLIKKFRTTPGYLHSSFSIPNFESRADGFYKAVRKNGLSSSSCIVHELTPSADGAYADMKALLASGEKLSRCYFADNDLIAQGAMRAFAEFGYNVPSDIAIVGFDNMPICEYLSPTLSTVDVPKRFMGETAVEKLFCLASGEKFSTKTEVMTTLVLRNSSSN